MTTERETFRIWVWPWRPQALPAEAVLKALRQADHDAYLVGGSRMPGPGIIVTEDLTRELTDFVAAVSNDGRDRVIVIVPDEAKLLAGDAWRVLRAGASDVLAWSVLSEPASAVVSRFERWRRVDELVSSSLVRTNLVGESEVWKSILRTLVEIALFTDAPLLLEGETGTGKELAARLVHTLDPRRSTRDLIVLDCTTIVPDLSGSELFGHERGAFTGAVAGRDGALALSDGGTLFLDEIGDLPPSMQPQLLRALQEHTYKRVGSDTWRKTDFRLVSATNRDLGAEEARGAFRRDLYHRVASWKIAMPPLRARVDDIIPLSRYFMASVRPGNPPPMDSLVTLYLLTREYAGNVRELRNLVLRVMARHTGTGPVTIGELFDCEARGLPQEPLDWYAGPVEQAVRRALARGLGLREIRRAIEDTAIRIAVSDADGNLQRAAARLAVTDRALQKRRAGSERPLPAALEPARDATDADGSVEVSPTSDTATAAEDHRGADR